MEFVSGDKKSYRKDGQRQKKEVIVISDSDPCDLRKACEKNNIDWKTISKFDLRGAVLEIVIDNLSKEEFEKAHKITPRLFINVKEL